MRLALLSKRLAACVNIATAPVESVYRWKGKIETAREFLLIVKTTASRLAELEKEVKRLHSYDVPEIVVLELAAGSKEYFRWLEENVRNEGDRLFEASRIIGAGLKPGAYCRRQLKV